MEAQKSNQRVAIYIDGGNFYRRLMEAQFPSGKAFDYLKFTEYLADDRLLISKRYYVGIVRNIDNTQKSKRMVQSQQKFLAGLEKEGFAVKRGRIVYDHIIREKGVDVKLATDLIIGAVDDLYDTAIVVSSDTDLIPALSYLRYKNKNIEYVGFSHRPSLGILKCANFSTLLRPQDVLNFQI